MKKVSEALPEMPFTLPKDQYGFIDDEGVPYRLVVKRITMPKSGERRDLMRCGHLLQLRGKMGPNDVIGSRTCRRCQFERPADVPSLLLLSHAQIMEMHWAWWFAERGLVFKQPETAFAIIPAA